MSRYVPSDYRGPNERPRSPPPRFNDRRPSVPSAFNGRPYDSTRDNNNGAPRGPRSQFESRPAPSNGPPPSGGLSRSSYVPQLRDLPPLGSSSERDRERERERDRGRPFKEREFERRDRAPTPPERSPPRNFRDSRDFPPRDADGPRGRRGSRDGPLSAGSAYPDGPSFSSAPFRGGFARGRGRGDFESRGGRGGRRTFDDRDLFRPTRDRSPPPRWGRDLSRDSRDADRRDERRFERREEDRRTEWSDREPRRDQAPPRAEPRYSIAPVPGPGQREPPLTGPHVDPGRLALLESTGAADLSMGRGPAAQPNQPPRRDQPETPSYLNGRAETLSNRYGSRGSSPPTQAPPVPAFTLSFAAPTPSQPTAPTQGQASAASNAVKQSQVKTAQTETSQASGQEVSTSVAEEKPRPPADAPVAPKAQTQTQSSKPQISSPPPTAPKAPRAHEVDASNQLGPRLHGVRSWDALPSSSNSTGGSRNAPDVFARPSWPSSTSQSPNMPQSSFASLNQPVSPTTAQGSRFIDLNPPTGPRASRKSPALPPASPRAPFASPRSENIAPQGPQGTSQRQTPPPSAPSGPRNRSYSVSPKATTVNVPTGPRASRVPPTAPRGVSEAAVQGFYRPPERLGVQPRAPAGVRGGRWHQWKQVLPSFSEKAIPAKRDYNGEERPNEDGGLAFSPKSDQFPFAKLEAPHDHPSQRPAKSPRIETAGAEKMDLDPQPNQHRTSSINSHSAKQSFFGQPVKQVESDRDSSDGAEHTFSSEDEDDSDAEDLTLFEAKFERQKRELEAQMVDLSRPQFRATTPLESIARLARISMEDAERLKLRQKDAKMDLDEPKSADDQQVPPATHSSGSGDEPEVQTPRADNDAGVTIEDNEEHKAVRRLRKSSPEVIRLPYLLKQIDEATAIIEDDRNVFDRDEDFVMSTLADVDDVRDEEEMTVEETFAENYRRWREECEDMDRFREGQDNLERQQSLEPPPEPEATPVVLINPVVEGRRSHKFSSEYDIEKVLKESEETARIEQERQEREALKAQADLLKEARLPDQQSREDTQRAMFVDHNRYRSPASLTTVFSYEPPPNNFTGYEQQVFIAAFKESPKRWGKIAAALPDPNKTYKDCIHHYYANKWDGRFRDTRTKKLKAGRGRGRGGKGPSRGRGTGAMADLSSTRVEDSSQPLNLTETGRPRRAAAPNHFGEKEAEAKAAPVGPSPAKKSLAVKQDGTDDGASEKQVRRRKVAGEKPGRKPKGTQPLATLAAAPAHGVSPSKHGLQNQPMKDDNAKLEDARLLASFQAGQASMTHVDSQMVFHHLDDFRHTIGNAQDDHERPKRLPTTTQPAKTAPSSYWSVPEQSDFIKYIKYFGTDFGAIAAHMGTKTHIMIKNHYQRQIDNGHRPELEEEASKANQRRIRGEDMGPPPTPTPITKRRYDNPTPVVPRPLAPQVEAMDIDEPTKPTASVPKHSSPPQLQSQMKFSPSAQQNTIPAPIAPPITSAHAPTSHPPATSNSTIQPPRFPPGPRLGFFSEQRVEPRQSNQPPIYRGQPTPPTQAQPPPPERSISGPPDPHDPLYMRTLQAEQDKALRLQQEQSQQERFDQMQRQSSVQQPPLQPPTAVGPLPSQVERKPIFEDRVGTPQKGPLQPAPVQARHPFVGSPAFAPMASAPASVLSNRSPFNPSPPKQEMSRPESVPSGPSPQPPPVSKVPEAPKRSNLFGILNSEPEEPRQAKRMSGGENLVQAPRRTESPANAPYPHNAHLATSSMSLTQPRASDPYMQTATPSSAIHRSSLGQQSSTPGSVPHNLKQEPSSGNGPMSQPSKHDWTRGVFVSSAQNSPVPQPATAFDRDGRAYYHHGADQHRHRATLSQLNAPARVNPSPPPLGSVPGRTHSRTPSYGGGGPNNPPSRDQRQAHRSQPPPPPPPPGPQASQPLHSTPYGQQPAMQAQNAAHHVHNSSIGGGGFPPMHHRSFSRENMARQEPPRQQEPQPLMQHRQTEQEWRRANEMRDNERHREAQYFAQRQEHDRQNQQAQYGRGPVPPPNAPLHPSSYAGPQYANQGPAMNLGLREQSMREAHAVTLQEEQRMQQEAERRRHEVMRDHQLEEIMRKEAALQAQRNTPLNGGYWPPPGR